MYKSYILDTCLGKVEFTLSYIPKSSIFSEIVGEDKKVYYFTCFSYYEQREYIEVLPNLSEVREYLIEVYNFTEELVVELIKACL